MGNEVRRAALSPSSYPYGVGGGSRYAMSDGSRWGVLDERRASGDWEKRDAIRDGVRRDEGRDGIVRR